MKRFLTGLVLGLILATAPTALATGGPIRLVVDGRDVTPSDVPPQSINGRVMVPARALAEALGATVGWNAELSAVVVSSSAPVADLDPTQWISLRALMTDTSLTITASDDLRIAKGNTIVLVSLVNSDNGNLQPILPLVVLIDGQVVRAAEARTDRTATWLPIEILREFGIIQ